MRKHKPTCGVPGCKDLNHADLSVELAGIRKQLNARLVTFCGESFVELYVRFPTSLPERITGGENLEKTFRSSQALKAAIKAERRRQTAKDRERRMKILRHRKARIEEVRQPFKRKKS